MPSEKPTFDIRFDGSELVLSPTQRSITDVVSVRSMTTEAERLLDQPRPNLVTDLVVDLGDVGLITSVGLNELIHLKQCADRLGVGVKLRSVASDLRQIFQITRLERVFDLEDEPVLHSSTEKEAGG